MFFVLVLLHACKAEPRGIAIKWKDNKAVAVEIPTVLLKKTAANAGADVLSITAAGDKNKTPILGVFTRSADLVSFEPVIPFSRGMVYEIRTPSEKLMQFDIPFETGTGPFVSAVYPQADTVPENVLKIYIAFNSPMSEGRSAKYVSLVKNGKDTLQDVFLDLQPELWNEDRTVLTLWLDPGRIKRDLQPNLKLGAPLHEQEKYTLIIARQWKDAQGRELNNGYTRSFVTTTRDEQTPDPNRWTFDVPAGGSAKPLVVDFKEQLDHFLLLEALTVMDAAGKKVSGSFNVNSDDRSGSFKPQQPWTPGKYQLVIDSKLEDLCGNNLNRPFDRDVTKTKNPSTQAVHKIEFVIR